MVAEVKEEKVVKIDNKQTRLLNMEVDTLISLIEGKKRQEQSEKEARAREKAQAAS